MNLEREVTILPGIGEKTAEKLKKAGISTVRDLFYYLPRAYESYTDVAKIADITPGKVTIRGKIDNINTRYARSRRLAITEATISDDTDVIRAVWFNQPYRLKQLEKGREYLFSGLYELKNGRYQLTSPTTALAPENASEPSQNAPERNSASLNTQKISNSASPNPSKTPNPATNSAPRNINSAPKNTRITPKNPKSTSQPPQNHEIHPVYPAKNALKPDDFKRLIEKNRPNFASIPDLLPETANSPKNRRKNALFAAHFPETEQEANAAKEYLAYEELFELILAAKLNQKENHKLKSEKIPYDNAKMHEFLAKLPYELTKGQKIAAWEIIQDLEKPHPMNRLLQGDVGAGKTVVAATAALQAANNGQEAALLAPTAVLALQHANGLERLLGPLGVKIALLTGATKHKSELKKQIKQGNVDLVIGTHALLTDDTEFKNLALVIIDEQHRFGVDQRQKLLLKSPPGKAPHLLSMTATPIPRSLQLTVFGDLDVSVIREMPKGRQPITTKILPETSQKDVLYPKIRTELEKGRQIYWICKSIEDSPSLETISVKKQAEKLKNVFRTAKIEFLHGRMKPAEKDDLMSRFSRGEIDILVSTTVVEVGVDVPNATSIVIMDAENYGLAQLHQLRGRVGRGQHQSFCYLITSGERPPSRRLRELENSTDGFHLAEVDLKLRGPGEIYGSLQHGALDLRIASLSDTHLIAKARKDVDEFVKTPENMLKYEELAHIIKKYQQLTTLN